MEISTHEFLQIPELAEGEIIAGRANLSGEIRNISVMESSISEEIPRALVPKDGAVLTSFASVRNDVEAQCRTLRFLKDCGQTIVVIYYVGVIMPTISQKLIDTANEIGLPVLCMPYNRCDLDYSTVIKNTWELMFRKDLQSGLGLSRILAQLSSLEDRNRTIYSVLSILSGQLGCPLILLNRMNYILASTGALNVTGKELVDAMQDLAANTQNAMLSGSITINKQTFTIRAMPFASADGENLQLVAINPPQHANPFIFEQAAHALAYTLSLFRHTTKEDTETALIRAAISSDMIAVDTLSRVISLPLETMDKMMVFCISDAQKRNISLNALKKHIQETIKSYNSRLLATCIGEFLVCIFFRRVDIDFQDELLTFLMQEKSIRGVEIPATDMLQFSENYALIQRELYRAVRIYPHRFFFAKAHLTFAEHCQNIIESSRDALSKTLSVLHPLRKHDSKYNDSLCSTMGALFLDTTMNTQEAAALLRIHPNTVQYRMRKIKEVLGDDCFLMPASMQYLSALAIERLLGMSEPRQIFHK